MLRMSRLRKFRRYKQFVTLWKVAAICYISIFTLGYLASGTGAYFVSKQENEQTIQAGTWWDGSELAFIGKPKIGKDSCPGAVLTVELKNNGEKMTEPTIYEVFFSEKGNPKKSGEKVGSGEISLLEKGEKVTLTHTVEQEGFYIFKTYQHPLYGEETEGKQEIWSKKVKLDCKEKQVKEKLEKEKVEEKKETPPSNTNSEQEEATNKKEDNQKEQQPEKENKEEPPTEEKSETETEKQEAKEQKATEEESSEEQEEDNVQTKQEQQSNGKEESAEDQPKDLKEEEGE
ncbi:amyloid fiber anchoring/assembly protein TapA [Oceanobacillus kapialis]|uniref:amyloid fiber anchoring/assembly protein TapA n=1 Tax=Oceanobacillus kapialis TaxID=481353 RepID=UPI0038512C6D